MDYRDKTRFNYMFLLFFSSILLLFNKTSKIYIVFCLIGLVGLFYNIIKQLKTNRMNINRNIILYLLIAFITYTMTINIINFDKIGYLKIFKMCAIYIPIIFLIFKLNNYELKYIEDFYKKFMFVFNGLAIINITEIIQKKSLFYSYITSNAENWQQVTRFGTDSYRTCSIFTHPIIYGLFLIILFWCNKLIIKSKYRYLLQLNIVINLYFTQSRSAWLSFAITLFLYYLKLFIINNVNNKPQLTYKKLTIYIFSLVGLILLLFIFNDITVKIFNEIFQRFITVTNDNYGDISRLQRLGAIELVTNHMLNNGITNFLFGNGYSSVAEFMRNNTVVISNFSTTDNQYFTMFYEFGFIGVLLYCSILIKLIINFFKDKKIVSINNLNSLCFIAISVAMFFFESFQWTDVFLFSLIIIVFFCFEDDNERKIYNI